MPVTAPSPYWELPGDVRQRLYLGDVRAVLSRLPSRSVQCVITSPPYWGLRDYGVEGQLGSEPSPDCGTHGQDQCGRCFVCAMIAVFRGVRRVLRDDGTLWLNLGDTYASRTDGSTGGLDLRLDELNGETRIKSQTQRPVGTNKPKSGLIPGNLVGVPWRVAFALQADGWILRQDIIWHKPSPMPESVRNRCTKAHEYVFLLTKGGGYFYDGDAISEKANEGARKFNGSPAYKAELGGIFAGRDDSPTDTRNKRTVWTIATRPYVGAHYATFPPKLIEPMILAGTSAMGACGKCRTPWRRVVEKYATGKIRERSGGGLGTSHRREPLGLSPVDGQFQEGVQYRTTGWEPGCVCGNLNPVVPCRVLDPFVGSGTTLTVCYRHYREGWGIDLNETYLRENAKPRIEKAVVAGWPNTKEFLKLYDRREAHNDSVRNTE